MINRFRVSRTLLRRLEELGLPPEAVLRQAGLPMGLLREEKILVSTEEFFALYRGIAEANDDPGFGLKLGTEGRVERYDPIKLAGSQGARFAMPSSGSRTTNNLPVQRKFVSSSAGMNLPSSSSGCSHMKKNPHFSSTRASHGLLASGAEALDDL